MYLKFKPAPNMPKNKKLIGIIGAINIGTIVAVGLSFLPFDLTFVSIFVSFLVGLLVARKIT
ncbi:MAG: hypothetical protein ACFFBD_09770 [Candidatus Hodarchaeota archaeon]